MKSKLFGKVFGRVFSKVVVTVMAVVMLFSVIAFGAGHCVMYDPRVGELQRRIEELEDENRLQAERVAELERENEELGEENRVLRLELRRIEAVAELEEFFEGFDEDDYSIHRIGLLNNWYRVVAYFEAGMTNIGDADSIDEIETVLEKTKTAMAGVPYELFAARIVEEEIFIYHGDDIAINLEFINQSGFSIVIWWWDRFRPHVPGYIEKPFHSDPGDDVGYFLENNQVIRNPWTKGGTRYSEMHISSYSLSIGVHELSFHFKFGSNISNIGSLPNRVIWSNTITLTVI